MFLFLAKEEKLNLSPQKKIISEILAEKQKYLFFLRHYSLLLNCYCLCAWQYKSCPVKSCVISEN